MMNETRIISNSGLVQIDVKPYHDDEHDLVMNELRIIAAILLEIVEEGTP